MECDAHTTVATCSWLANLSLLSSSECFFDTLLSTESFLQEENNLGSKNKMSLDNVQQDCFVSNKTKESEVTDPPETAASLFLKDD